MAQQLKVSLTLVWFVHDFERTVLFVKAHEMSACELREQLALVRLEAPPLKAKGRPVEEFFFKERYLTQEVERMFLLVALKL